MKYKLLTLALSFSLTHSLFATTEKPTACPSQAAIKATGFNIMEHSGKLWFAYNTNQQYDTNVKWSIGIWNDDEGITDENEAKIKAIAALDLMTIMEGPLEKDNEWICYYTDNTNPDKSHHFGFATTKHLAHNFMSLSKYRR